MKDTMTMPISFWMLRLVGLVEYQGKKKRRPACCPEKLDAFPFKGTFPARQHSGCRRPTKASLVWYGNVGEIPSRNRFS